MKKGLSQNAKSTDSAVSTKIGRAHFMPGRFLRKLHGSFQWKLHFVSASFFSGVLVTAKNIISRHHAQHNQDKSEETVMNHKHDEHSHRKTKQGKSNNPFHHTITKKAYIRIIYAFHSNLYTIFRALCHNTSVCAFALTFLCVRIHRFFQELLQLFLCGSFCLRLLWLHVIRSVVHNVLGCIVHLFVF